MIMVNNENMKKVQQTMLGCTISSDWYKLTSTVYCRRLVDTGGLPRAGGGGGS